jgi:hypothetical protein
MIGIIDKNFIFSKVSQQEIFESFLNLPVIPGKKYCSPLRKDDNPTCEYRYANDKLYFIDYSGDFSGDCFDAIQRMYGINYYQALQVVAQRFNLADTSISVSKQPVSIVSKDSFKSYRTIEIMVRDWNDNDFHYWNKFEIDLKTLQFFNVYPCRYVFIDGEVVYRYFDTDPAYAYRFDIGKYKVYFPFRTRMESRFLSNTTHIQGLNQLPSSGNTLILTKSMKDIMVLRRFGFFSIAFQSETIIPKPEDIEQFLSNWKRIFSFYDFDRAGIKSSNKMRKLYGIKPIFLTNGRFNTYDYGAKDPAEFVEKHGKNQAFKLIKLWKSYL